MQVLNVFHDLFLLPVFPDRFGRPLRYPPVCGQVPRWEAPKGSIFAVFFISGVAAVEEVRVRVTVRGRGRLVCPTNVMRAGSYDEGG